MYASFLERKKLRSWESCQRKLHQTHSDISVYFLVRPRPNVINIYGRTFIAKIYISVDYPVVCENLLTGLLSSVNNVNKSVVYKVGPCTPDAVPW
jgi:hypothetical protein